MNALRVRTLASLVLAGVVFALPTHAAAQVVISEIMYDLETGSDSGREWIEITNTGSAPADVYGWKLFEASTNHGFSVVQGTTTIAAGASAVMADNAAKFLADWPSYLGALFDSTFSLSNTGEALVLRDKSLTDIHAVTYASDWGASGDGKTLQYANGTFQAAAPTPGSFSVSQASSQSPIDSATSTTSAQTTAPEEQVSSEAVTVPGSKPIEPSIFVSAGKNITTIAGAAALFNASAVGKKGEPISNARFLWNFGDGARGEGQKVTHIYRFPGEYVVMVEVASGELSATGRLTATAISSPVTISSVMPGDGYIEVANSGVRELDLSGWILVTGAKSFVLPPYTTLLPGKKTAFANVITGLNPSSAEVVLLAYPNGAPAYQYGSGAVQIPPPNFSSATPPAHVAVRPAAVAVFKKSTVEHEASQIPATTTQTAAVSESIPKGTSESRIWYGLFVSLVAVSVGAALYGRKLSK